MPKYRFESSDNESSFESDDETDYIPDKRLGGGLNSEVRQFVSKLTGKSKAVLSPSNPSSVDFDEAKTKYSFFKKIYPNKRPHLLIKSETYRLILPVIPGISYSQLSMKDASFSLIQQINVFLSAIKAIEEAHSVKYIILDLHVNNIHYDLNTGKSFLVDGGLSCLNRTKVPDTFQVISHDERLEKIQSYPHIAPECWYMKHEIPARESMDIYSLGFLMTRLFNDLSCPKITLFIQSCLSLNPNKRPTLSQLKKDLNGLSAYFFPSLHSFINAGHEFPSTRGSVKEILCALPACLWKRLQLEQEDNDIDVMKKLVLSLEADRSLVEEAKNLAVIAAERNYPEVLCDLQEQGMSLNIWHKGNTLAHIAVEQGNLSVIEQLANLGIDLNKQNLFGDTPVFLAAKKGDSLAIQALEKQGVDLKSLNRVGQTLVHVAAKYGHAHLIDVLAFYGVSLHASSEAGETPMYMAVEYDHISVLNKLIRHGVTLDKPNVYGVNFPNVDLENGNIKIINKVVSHRPLLEDTPKP